MFEDIKTILNNKSIEESNGKWICKKCKSSLYYEIDYFLPELSDVFPRNEELRLTCACQEVNQSIFIFDIVANLIDTSNLTKRLEMSSVWQRWRKKDFLEYKEYINSIDWKIKSDEAKYRVGYRCQICNRPDKKHPDILALDDIGNAVTLNVHHRTYARLGQELPEDLTVLCSECHELFHKHYQRDTLARLFTPKRNKS